MKLIYILLILSLVFLTGCVEEPMKEKNVQEPQTEKMQDLKEEKINQELFEEKSYADVPANKTDNVQEVETKEDEYPQNLKERSSAPYIWPQTIPQWTEWDDAVSCEEDEKAIITLLGEAYLALDFYMKQKNLPVPYEEINLGITSYENNHISIEVLLSEETNVPYDKKRSVRVTDIEKDELVLIENKLQFRWIEKIEVDNMIFFSYCIKAV